jgi:hypothetical protein
MMPHQCRVHWRALFYERLDVGVFVRLNENHLYLIKSGSSKFLICLQHMNEKP